MSKAVVLAAGAGTRMRRPDDCTALSADQAAAASAGLKTMMPFGPPFLDYVLSGLADVGVGHVCLVVGPEPNALRQVYATRKTRRLRIAMAVQPAPRGTADALAAAAGFVGDDDFIMVNADNLYPPDALRALGAETEAVAGGISGGATIGFTLDALAAGGVPAARAAQFAVIETDGAGMLTAIHEKPSADWMADQPQPLLVSMNCWRLAPAIFESCAAIERSPRGEFELPDAVMHSIRHLGQAYRVIPCSSPVLDLSCRADVAVIERALANKAVDL